MSLPQANNYFKGAAVLFWVYFFLVSISLMGAAFSGLGENFAKSLIQITANPFIGLFIGILATSLVQSSSTTTSIVVGMVSSETLTLGGAIPIIMGANIGTTVTNLIVSLAHINRREEFKRAISGAAVHDFFNVLCVCILLPIEILTGFLQKAAAQMAGLFQGFGGLVFTSPLKLIIRPTVDFIYNLLVKLPFLADKASYYLMVIFSIVILFLSLSFIVKIMRSLVLNKAENILNSAFGRNVLFSIFAGFIFTAIVQSSSITTSLMIPLVAAGILTVEMIFPIALGANLGTTLTTILASLATGNITAVTVAFAHFLFNLIGILIIYPLKAIRNIPIFLAYTLGNLAYKKRRYGVIFVLVFFFIIPGLLIVISKLAR